MSNSVRGRRVPRKRNSNPLMLAKCVTPAKSGGIRWRRAALFSFLAMIGCGSPGAGALVGSGADEAGTAADDDGGFVQPAGDGSDDDATANDDDATAPGGGSDASVTPHVDAGGVDATAGTEASTVHDGGNPADTSTGGGDAGHDASTGGTCVESIPAGWSLVTYNTTLDSCPTGFAEHITSGPPTVGAGACSCTCSVASTGSCGQGSLSMLTNPGHGNDSCSIAWFTATVNGTQCIAVPAAAQGGLGNFQASPLAASGAGGTCTSASHANTGALTEPTQRYCDVPPANAETLCNGTPPAGFSSCIIAGGQVACPASTPFTHPFTVEDSAALSCGTCSACSVSTSCGSPTVSVFTNGSCTAPAALSFPVNGACQANPAEQTVLSMQYNANATGSCAAGASAASVQLNGPHTICCR
jgi:hypothetical protein